ncbi:MAG: 30S ribosomal protein S1 [Candidatus Moranbacteria bacterium]|nr:30S ribosomal protein S1 [Candidatus Moranbacteria bacterium]
MSATRDLLDKIVSQVKGEDEKKASSKKVVKKEVSLDENASMEELMQVNVNDSDFPKVGDIIESTVIDISSSVTLLDIGLIGTGMVIGREAKSGLAEDDKIKIGSKVTATVTDLDNDEGYIELSIREASYGRAWDDLDGKKESKETVPTKILDANRGGLMIEINGITGFLPVSQLSSENYPRVEDGDKNKILEILKALIGKELGVRILDIDQEDEKLIVSEKAAHSEKERQVIADLSIGDEIEGYVSGVVDFGAFIKFAPKGSDESKNLEGLVHISELAWQLIDNPREIIKVNDKVKAKIIGIDDTRISLSIKALTKDPWSQIEKKYEIDEIYKGKVDKINHFGAFVYLDSDIHGLAHISEFQESFPGKKLEDKMTAGEEYMWKVISIESKAHRMGLVLVDEKAEKTKKKKVVKKETKKEVKSKVEPKEKKKSEDEKKSEDK